MNVNHFLYVFRVPFLLDFGWECYQSIMGKSENHDFCERYGSWVSHVYYKEFAVLPI
jgi:hypothetical protein